MKPHSRNLRRSVLTGSIASHCRIAFALAGALAAMQSAKAATLYWDGNGTGAVGNPPTAGVGGAGTWDTTLSNWWNGTAYQLWNGAGGQDIADFRGTGNVAITVSGTLNANRLQFSANTFTFNTGTINFTGTPGVIDFNNTNSQTFNATLSGAVKFQATGGTGTVGTAASGTINGNNTGLTSVEVALNSDQNSMIINQAGAFGAAGTAVKLTKGVVNLGNNLAPNNNVPVTYNAWATELAGGTIRGRFSASTLTGATTLTANSGLTTRAAAGVSLIFSNTATINLGSSTLTSDSDSASAGITLNGVISGTGNIKTDTLALSGGGNGTGVTTLGAANTFSGNATTTANRGTLALANVNALQNATLDTGAAAGTQVVTFTVAGTNTYNLGALTGSDALAIGGNTISVGAKAVDTTFAADISGATGGLTKVGGNALTLSAATSFSGATLVSGGTLGLTGAGAVNGSSGITVNGAGAKFLAGGATAVSPVTTLTQGTLTGSGTVNTVNVGAGTGGIISNNNGVSGAALTIGTLTLAGGANINLFSSTTAADLIVGTLTNNSSASTVTITANNAGGWTNGSTYNLIAYTTLGGSGGNNFAQAVNNLSARQSATWGDTGSAITLAIAGDNPYWVGDTDGNWNTTTINNWKLVTGGGYTTFLASDDVLFNNNATGTRTIDITEDVAPNTVVFDNNALNPYTVGSIGLFGITSGSLAKNGAGTVTIATNNSYTGGTTLNDGILNVNRAAALGAASSLLTLNGGTLDNTFGSAITTNSHPVSINGNFAFTGTNNLNLGTGASTLGAAAGASRTITVNGGKLTIGGAIANGATANSLVKDGAGTLVLSGASTFNGSATLNSAILRAESNAGALGAGTLNLAGGELQLANDSALAFGRNTTVSANAQITSDTLTAVPGVAHSLGTLGIGANTLTIAKGANATGATAGVTFTGTTTLTGTPTFSIGANSTLTLAAVVDGGNSATFTGAGTFRQTGVWGNGAGGLTFDAGFTGSAVLSAANTFTGTTTITGGTVIAQNSAALGSNLTGTTVSGGTLDLGGTLATNALNLGTEVLTVSGSGVGGNGALVNNGSNDQINATGRIVLAGATTFGGTKRWDLRSSTPTLDMGGFDLTKVGGNQISLVGVTVSNPGNITVNNGIFGVETTTDLGGSAANALNVNGATLLYFNNTVPIVWSTNLNGGTISQNSGSTTASGPLALTGANTINVTGSSLTQSGAVSGAGGFNKTGGGALIFSTANSYDGATTITGGQVRISDGAGLGSTVGGTSVLSSGALQVNSGAVTNAGETISLAGGGTDFFGALQAGAGGGTWSGNVTLGDATVRLGATTGNTLTVTGSIADGAGTGFTVSGQGGTGVVILNPTTSNNYTGTTSVLRGILRLGKDDALPTGTVLDVDSVSAVADAATFDMAGFSQTVSALQDTAATNINGVVTNSVAATTSTLTVNGGASTIFNGTIQNGAGTVALTKNGGSTLTLAGATTFTGATRIDGGTLEVSGASTLSGTANITVNTGGTLLLSGNGGTNAKLNTAATMDLAGGTLQVSDTIGSTLDQTLGTLTLSASSVIDFGNFASGNTFRFADSASLFGSWSGTLSIYNWTDGADHLFFGNGSGTGLEPSQLDQIKFFSDAGSTILPFAPGYSGFTGGFGEVTPVPEPSSVAMLMGLLGLVGWRERRKAHRARRAT